MLTISQQLVIESFAKELIKLLQDVIRTRPIKRVSRRKVNGKYVDTRFEAPVNASGNLAKTLRYELNDTSLSIYANDYIYDLIWGKPPSKSAMDNDHNLEGKIKSWMSDKGISSLTTSDDNLSHLITNKIQKFGSSIYLAHHGQNSGLLENILNEQMIKNYNAKFTQQLSEEFKAVFNA